MGCRKQHLEVLVQYWPLTRGNKPTLAEGKSRLRDLNPRSRTMGLSRESSLNRSHKSLIINGRKWTATIVFMAAEIRMMMDMAELFSKNTTFKPPTAKTEHLFVDFLNSIGETLGLMAGGNLQAGICLAIP
ncbi:hypothetical protein C0Q70_19478 [Pomacea canaliculata]|uniref:Uncharacterized protein n=1 Tax=Pomacea canaliculata TaxID=400727 RepID=A0A2T7NJG0_POMCA|nr:hypothetical protein C0Q70_19478 [Pomacea canaliculata]